jgi:outer membrane lipoprotein-sorting protein
MRYHTPVFLEEVSLNNKLFITIIFIILLFAGCSEKTDEELFYEAQKKIVSLDTYTCTANITVYGNKNPQKYTARHWFAAPDKYRIEIENPESLKGKTTIYNGKRAWICHPRIGQDWLMENFSSSREQKIFIGYFIHNFINTETAKVNRKIIDDKEYILLQTDIPGNHPYFNKEILWFDIKKYYPVMLQVLDVNNKVRIDVKYLNFRYNEDIDDKIFTIE